MFRKMRRFGQQIPEEECVRILREEPRGVLSVLGDDGYPYGVPIDFYYDETNGKLYFHGAKTGHKVDALRRDSRVSFCVWDRGFRKEGDWALNIRSVICFGRVRFVTDPEETEDAARKIGLKYYPTAESVEEELRKDVKRVQILEMTVEHMTGKLVHEK